MNKEGDKIIEELRELFIKRMTVSGETQDRRRNDYNIPIFFDRDGRGDYVQFMGERLQMDMVLQCFDNAVKDWRKTFAERRDSDDTDTD